MRGMETFIRDFTPRAEAGIKHALSAQPIERCSVISHMLRLQPYRLWPRQAQPMEVFKNGVCEFRLATDSIYIFDTEKKCAAITLRNVISKQC
jgi:hypothetical protein